MISILADLDLLIVSPVFYLSPILCHGLHLFFCTQLGDSVNMADRDISPNHSYDDKTVSPPPEKGGAEVLEHAGQARRGSTAVNIVENPLQVRSNTLWQEITTTNQKFQA